MNDEYFCLHNIEKRREEKKRKEKKRRREKEKKRKKRKREEEKREKRKEKHSSNIHTQQQVADGMNVMALYDCRLLQQSSNDTRIQRPP